MSNSVTLDGVMQAPARPDDDNYVLLIHPLVLGTGRRLFADDSTFATLRLVDATTTTTGVIISTYQPAQPVAEGTLIREPSARADAVMEGQR